MLDHLEKVSACMLFSGAGKRAERAGLHALVFVGYSLDVGYSL